MHLGLSKKNRAILWGAVKIAPAAAEKRVILVHAAPKHIQEDSKSDSPLCNTPLPFCEPFALLDKCPRSRVSSPLTMTDDKIKSGV